MKDQRRKGQKLIGEVTLKLQSMGYLDPNEKDCSKINKAIELYIWNMNDNEFDEIMK